MKLYRFMNSLKGKYVIITGGNGYLGIKMTEMFLHFGSNVILIDKKGLKNRKANKKITFIQCDLSNEQNLSKTMEFIKRAFKKIDILINNAAFNLANSESNETSGFWDSMMKINLKAGFLLMEKALPLLKKHPGGCIINISSIYGFCGPQMDLYHGTKMKNEATYAASKAGLIQLTRYYATKWAPAIRVNSISPGGIFRNQNKKFVERYKARTPLRRMANEDDIVGAVAFLASDMSKYITGHNLIVDGGWSVW